jgi:hypothetical protein
MISLVCSSCSKTSHVPVAKPGDAIECPHCHGIIRVPFPTGTNTNTGLVVGLALGGVLLVVGLPMIIIICLAAIAVLGQKASGTFTSVGTPIGPVGTIRSTDGASEVTIPSHWSTLQLHSQANIQVGNETAGEYLIVLAESKADFAAGVTYRDYAEINMKSIRKNYDDLTVIAGPTERIINGRPALQYEYTATSKDSQIRIHALKVVVDGKGHFYQIIVWGLVSKFPARRATYEQVINSFREIDAADPAPPEGVKKN